MSDKKYFSKIGFKYLIGTIIIFAIQILAMGVVGFLGGMMPELADNYNVSFLAMMLAMYLIAVPIMAVIIKKIPANTVTEKKTMTFWQWLQAFAMCYAITYVGNIIGNIITSIIGVVKGSGVSNVVEQITGSIHPLTTLLIVVIMAPVVEEILFRKLLVDRTAQYGEGVAIVLSGFMFGLYHGNLNQFAYAFGIGCFLAFIYIRTGNLKYPVAIHMLINFLGSFVGVKLLEVSGYAKIIELTTNGASEAELTQAVMSNLPGMLGMCIYSMCIFGVVIFGIVLFISKWKQMALKPGEITIEKGSRFKTVILNWGMGLYSIFWIVQIIAQLLS